MTKIAQIDDRGAASAWSPIASHADVVALGTKDSAAVGFDDHGGVLELFDLEITCPTSNPSPRVIGSVKTTTRFSSIAWTAGVNTNTNTNSLESKYSMGLIAGGMADGSLHIYNPRTLVQEYTSTKPSTTNASTSLGLLSVTARNNGAISAMQFNPHIDSKNLLAAGGSHGEIIILNLDNPQQPTLTIPTQGTTNANITSNAEITHMAWNTEVSHILASSSANGTAVIWDLRQNKPWCDIRCEPSGAPIASLAWNPAQGMHFISASADDRNPVLKLWDLRASMNMPLAVLEGHTQGILSMDWCPHDDSLLLTCAKDNRTLLWDIQTLQPISEIPNNDAVDATNHQQQHDHTSSASALYGGGLSTSQQRRYNVQWSPLRRGVALTSSLDRKVQAHSVIGAAASCARPPKWMKPSSGVSFGFGGSLVSFTSSHRHLLLDNFVEEPTLAKLSLDFESIMATGDYAGLCHQKADMAKKRGDVYESHAWEFMKFILGDNARMNILQYIGFDSEKIQKIAMEFNTQEDNSTPDVSNLSLQDSSITTSNLSPAAQSAINRALLVGNFDAAVECCFRSGNPADALILASCGGGELWAKAQAQYFEQFSKQRPYLSLVSAIIQNQLGDYVIQSNPTKWKETLGFICTYASSEDFASFCQTLGEHLEASNHMESASLCFICASNLEKVTKYWAKLLTQRLQSSTEGIDYPALHDFIEKTSMFMKISSPNQILPEEVGQYLFSYAKALCDQGLFESAAKYCQSNDRECKELKDRLYRSKDSQLCVQGLGSIPEFPYTYVNVGVAPAHSKYDQPSVTSNGGGNSTKAMNTSNTNRYTGSAASNGHYHENVVSHDSYSGTAASGSHRNQTPTTQESELPPGWMAYQDPSSGQTYYANQNTGESSWEKPSIAPVQQPVSTVSSMPASAPSMQTSNATNMVGSNSNGNVQSSLASKYGDGFVTSASHPELAAQYGNVGTSNPYTNSSRPGTAVVNKIEKAPVSGTFNPSQPPQVSPEFKPLVDELVSNVANLGSNPNYQLSLSEKKQLAEIEKGVAIFTKRVGRNDVEVETIYKVENILNALRNGDYGTANAIQTSLVDSAWKEHKDWLKGMKFYIQLSAKLYQ